MAGENQPHPRIKQNREDAPPKILCGSVVGQVAEGLPPVLEIFLATLEQTALILFGGWGGKTMRGRILAGLFLFSLFLVVGGDAQSPNITERPVWTLEFIKVMPENFGAAMGYLDDHWMRVRAEAKVQGAVLDYHLMSNGGMVTPGHKVGDQNSIALLTKYKNMDAFTESQKVFDSIRGRTGWQTGGAIMRWSPENLFEPLITQVFVEEPETSSGLKLLTKQ